MKWEPAAAMVAVVTLGAWLVWGPPRVGGVQLREGARIESFQVAGVRGVIEILEPDTPPLGMDTADTGSNRGTSYRFITRDGSAGGALTHDELTRVLGAEATDELTARSANPLFRLLKITSWGNALWVLLGLGGQALFSARMLLQWVASEKSGKNIITVSFWWISLIAGIILFTYFAWRQDIVGVLGQSTGLVVYARNIKLHYKNIARARRQADRAAAGTHTWTTPGTATDPAPNPMHDPDPSAVPMVEMPREEKT